MMALRDAIFCTIRSNSRDSEISGFPDQESGAERWCRLNWKKGERLWDAYLIPDFVVLSILQRPHALHHMV